MEKKLITAAAAIQVSLSKSMEAGQEFVPVQLLSLIKADTAKSAVPGVFDLDRSHARFEAMQRDFAFLTGHQVQHEWPTHEEQERLTGLMRWLRRELVEWTSEADVNSQTLSAIFSIAAFCGKYPQFWDDLAETTSTNIRVVAQLSKQFVHLEVAMSLSSLSRTPLSDAEFLGRFLKADRERNWTEIISEWPRFSDFLEANEYLSQSVLYLSRFAPKDLSAVLEGFRQTVPVMLILSTLNVSECLLIARCSANRYVQIGSVLRILQQHRTHQQTLEHAEAASLTQLLQVIAEDEGEWERWMDALNRYPFRFPQLQTSLGKALAHAPDPTLKQYVDSIYLGTTGSSRVQVAECLRSFRMEAAPDRRKSLWTFAHDRWLEWNFREKGPNESLMRIGLSDLDFAIVGFALECMNADELKARCESLAKDLFVIDDEWHSSEVAFIEACSRILSTFQPYAYSRTIDGEDWLSPEGKYIIPFDPRTQRYLTIYFHIGHLIPGWNEQSLSAELPNSGAQNQGSSANRVQG